MELCSTRPSFTLHNVFRFTHGVACVRTSFLLLNNIPLQEYMLHILFIWFIHWWTFLCHFCSWAAVTDATVSIPKISVYMLPLLLSRFIHVFISLECLPRSGTARSHADTLCLALESCQAASQSGCPVSHIPSSRVGGLQFPHLSRVTCYCLSVWWWPSW